MMAPSIFFAAALTREQESRTAADRLASEIERQMAGRSIDLLFLYLSYHFTSLAPALSQQLRERLIPRLFLGCTAEGVIGSREEIEGEAAISAIAAHLPEVELAPFFLSPADWHALLNNPSALHQASLVPDDSQLLILLADPFSTPIEQILAAFQGSHGSLPIVGGMASGSQQPGGNLLLLNDRCLQEGLVGVALAGPIEVDIIVSQGCRPIGHPFTVTAAQDNVIAHLDGTPPLLHLQQLIAGLTEEERTLLQNGLYIGRAIQPAREPLGRGDFLVRGVIGVDQESGAIVIGDYVQVGETIQFHLRDATTAEEDLEMMLLPQSLYEPPSGALLFSCNGRGTRLYDHPHGDVSTIQEALGNVSLAGFFCAGELGPVGERNFLHGHTASLALFRSRAAESE